MYFADIPNNSRSQITYIINSQYLALRQSALHKKPYLKSHANFTSNPFLVWRHFYWSMGELSACENMVFISLNQAQCRLLCQFSNFLPKQVQLDCYLHSQESRRGCPRYWSGALFSLIFYADVVTGLDHHLQTKGKLESDSLWEIRYRFLSSYFWSGLRNLVSVTALARD